MGTRTAHPAQVTDHGCTTSALAQQPRTAVLIAFTLVAMLAALLTAASPVAAKAAERAEVSAVTPRAASATTSWRHLVTGEFHTCGIKKNRTLWCWGFNGRGNLGLGDKSRRYKPVKVGDATWQAISLGWGETCGVQTNGTLWCWGNNPHRHLGTKNKSAKVLTPSRVGTGTDWDSVAISYVGVQCALRDDQTLWCWGNGTSSLGLGPDVPDVVTKPTQVGTAQWRMVETAAGSGTCGIQVDDTLWCWGSNEDSSEPSRHGTDTWTSVSLSDSGACAVRSDSTLWCDILWDDPEQIGTASWSTVAVGYDHRCGIKTTGSLWCWGSNSVGQLGQGDTKARTKPARVLRTRWSSISAGSGLSCGLDATGTGRCWGINQWGQVGIGARAKTRLKPYRLR